MTILRFSAGFYPESIVPITVHVDESSRGSLGCSRTQKSMAMHSRFLLLLPQGPSIPPYSKYFRPTAFFSTLIHHQPIRTLTRLLCLSLAFLSLPFYVPAVKRIIHGEPLFPVGAATQLSRTLHITLGGRSRGSFPQSWLTPTGLNGHLEFHPNSWGRLGF